MPNDPPPCMVIQAEADGLRHANEQQQAAHEALMSDMDRKMKSSREFLEQKDELNAKHKALLDTLAAERKAAEKRFRC